MFEHVTVIDVEHGEHLRDQRVIIEGNRIRALGNQITVPRPPGAQVIDAQGKYLIPGLWDMHAHPGIADAPNRYALADAVYREWVANGILGIRDAGSAIPLDSLQWWKREIAASRRIGPRMIVSGPAINEPDDQCTREHHPASCVSHYAYLSRLEDAAPLVDSLKAAGADMIKLHGLPPQLWFALAAAARRARIPFGGHFRNPSDTVDGLAASDSGARILDHGPWAKVCGAEGDTLWSLTRCAAAATHLRRNHTWIAYLQDPTGHFTWFGQNLEVWLPDTFRSHAMRYTRPGPWPEPGDKAWQPPTAAERRQLPRGADWAAVVSDSVRRGRDCQRARLVYAADVPWLPGPDFDFQGNFRAPTDVHLALLRPVLCGVPPLWVLRAATLEPARALALADSLGTVAAGKVADLVLLEGDPLEDIWNITKIAAVIANGRYFDRAALDRLLSEADAEWREVVAAQERARRTASHP